MPHPVPPCPTLSHPVPPFQPGLLCTIAILRLVTKVIKIEGVRTRNPSPNKRAPPCPTLPALGNSDRRPTGPLVFFGRSQFWPPKGWDRVGHFCTVAYTETSIKTESDHTQQTTCPTLPRPCPRLTANAPVSLGHILGAHSSFSKTATMCLFHIWSGLYAIQISRLRSSRVPTSLAGDYTQSALTLTWLSAGASI